MATTSTPIPQSAYRSAIASLSVFALSTSPLWLPTLASRAAATDFILPSGTPFGADFWGDNCPALEATYANDCGSILDGTTARVNIPINTGNGSVSGVTLWTNSPGAGRDKNYLLSFKMTIENGDDLNLTAFYRINDGPRQLVFTSGSQDSPSNLILYANQSFTFGLKADNSLPLDSQNSYLLIERFSATPYAPVTAPLVPAPLPAIGAASLFLGSRRLKKRMVQQRALRLARRNLAPALRSILPG